jgi:RsiW-degrading membrane proteinase PrsW (M82 family)
VAGDVVIANLLASAGLVLLIYLFDYNEKEPVWTLVGLYVLFILATFDFGKVKALLFTRFGWHPPFWVTAFFVAGFCEEAVKLVLMLAFVWRLRSFDEESDGIIYYLVAAAGFSVMENVGYSLLYVVVPYLKGMHSGEFHQYGSALKQIVLLRMVSGHIFFNVVSGFFFGLARFSRHRMWIPLGFVLSVALHGFWNEAALNGWLLWYALGLFIVDAVLIAVSVRRSFYFKFMTRLRGHVGSLVREAKESGLGGDLVVLMEGILANVKRLRTLEGKELKSQARAFILALPAHANSVPLDGPDGLTARLLRLNGILGRDLVRTGWMWWGGIFLRFFLAGFIVLMILIRIA